VEGSGSSQIDVLSRLYLEMLRNPRIIVVSYEIQIENLPNASQKVYGFTLLIWV
jgi:hypothetical protein